MSASIVAVNRTTFERDGYIVVGGLFEPDEAESIRADTVALVARLAAQGVVGTRGAGESVVLFPRGDMLTYPELRKVLLDPRLVSAVTEILGDTPAFWGESGVNVGDDQGRARAWHTDAYETPVTHGRGYPLIRCGLYLQDTTRHSDGLAVVAGSHVRDLLAPTFANRLRRGALPYLGMRGSTLVESRPGDLVVWDMRLWHAGEAIRFRPAPSRALPAAVQDRLPASLRMPSERKRVVMFPTFGLPGADLDSYLTRQRELPWVQEIWRESKFPDSVVDDAAAAGINVIRPVDYYGRDSESSRQSASDLSA